VIAKVKAARKILVQLSKGFNKLYLWKFVRVYNRYNRYTGYNRVHVGSELVI